MSSTAEKIVKELGQVGVNKLSIEYKDNFESSAAAYAVTVPIKKCLPMVYTKIIRIKLNSI